MERRDFIKGSVGAAVTAFFIPSAFNEISATAPIDLVAVKNATPDILFDRAIEALGGMSAFVKKNQTVVVKPNIGWDVPPERAANTNPQLVRRIIEHCYSAGAKKVYVFDHTCDDWKKSYANSGIERAALDAGAAIMPADNEKYYIDINIPKGKVLKSTKVHHLIVESDVFINVPVLKNHSSAKLTISMKNLMGIMWDRKWWHRNDLQQCIADFCTWKCPDLNVVDAYNVLLRNGPRGVSVDDVSNMKSLIASRDIVAADAAASKLFGMEPDKVDHIKIAAAAGIGRMDLDKLNIKRIKVS
ncbi:MAG: DUF362 domain-containing protein [Candidatus Kapabacteria bacterium]|nr:DUF362 domain-containing protein [Candidatus Kapabacteria bacterium]